MHSQHNFGAFYTATSKRMVGQLFVMFGDSARRPEPRGAAPHPRRVRRLSARLTIAPVLAAVVLLGTACSANLWHGGPATPATGPASLNPWHGGTEIPATDPASVAGQDAAALLAAFAVPPGAAASTTEPAGTPSELDGPAPEISTATSVTSTGWWVVDSSDDEVYAWVKSHDVNTPQLGVSYGGGPHDMGVSYSEPATAPLFSRRIDVNVAPLDASRCVIRVTVQDVYRPVKPAAEVVPATAYLLATLQPATFGLVSKPTPSPRIVTVTDRSKITEIAGLINALPTLPHQVLPCPSDSGARIELDFKTVANGTTLATVVIYPGGCSSVSVSIAGTEEPTLDPDATSRPGGLEDQVASILGASLN